MNEYRNSQGKMVVIAKMHDNHLWSAYRKYSERLTRLNDAMISGKVTVDASLAKNKSKLTEMVDSFKAELESRNLL